MEALLHGIPYHVSGRRRSARQPGAEGVTATSLHRPDNQGDAASAERPRGGRGDAVTPCPNGSWTLAFPKSFPEPSFKWYAGGPYKEKTPRFAGSSETGATGLEPATSGVTGRRSNQLNYAPGEA